MQDGTGFLHQEQLHHRVPALDLRGLVSIGHHVDIIGEYVGATRHFNSQDMSYNNHGAKPSAYDLQAAYSFMILDNKPSSVGIGYAKSYQALALKMPLSRYSLVFNSSMLRHTLQTIELSHDRAYGASQTANGPAISGVTCSAAACSSSSKSNNAITAQFDYYF
jgi:hypothetical protein